MAVAIETPLRNLWFVGDEARMIDIGHAADLYFLRYVVLRRVPLEGNTGTRTGQHGKDVEPGHVGHDTQLLTHVITMHTRDLRLTLATFLSLPSLG